MSKSPCWMQLHVSSDDQNDVEHKRTKRTYHQEVPLESKHGKCVVVYVCCTAAKYFNIIYYCC